MAKKRGQGGTRAGAAAAASEAQRGEAPPAARLPELDPKDPATEGLLRARASLARGDLRKAGSLAREALQGNPSAAARAEASRLLADSAPDRAALLVSLVVLTAIAIAAWAGLLHRH